MRNTNRALAAAAVGALAALTLSTAPALAQPDVPPVPDPTTCSDALTALVKVRTTENGLGARITVLEQDDKTSAKALHMAQQDDNKARQTLRVRLGDYNAAKALVAKWDGPDGIHGTADDIPAATVIDGKTRAQAVAAQTARQSEYEAANTAVYGPDGTAAKLDRAQRDYNRTHSALLDIRARLGGAHDDVARITVIVGKLCNQTPPPPPVTETTEAPAPVDVTPGPSNNGTVIVNNPSIGQVPTGSNTGGGSEAASVG